MDKHLISYYIGIFLVFITHIIMLFTGDNAMKIHACINLLAACLIAYYFMNKEKYIKY